MTDTNYIVKKKFNHKSDITAVVEIVQWLLVALILALYFRGFVMEAYRIPTGSMANTLKGAHFSLYCVQCGSKFDRNYESYDYDLPEGAFPSDGKALPYDCVCPNCNYTIELDNAVKISNGDRILVLKCLYQFFEPKRWDVITFKDPTTPSDNMIKRLVGLPNETVNIKRGDIYINGKIVRKNSKLQQRLWVPVYINDFQPIKPEELSFNDHNWINPLKIMKGSEWKIDQNNKTTYELSDSSNKVHWIEYNNSFADDFKADIAYNGFKSKIERPYCSDLMVSYLCRPKSELFKTGAQISRYGSTYRGWFESNKLKVAKITDSGLELLVERSVKPYKFESVNVEFSILDGFVEFKFGKSSVGKSLNDTLEMGYLDIAPELQVFGSGELEYSNLAIYRDLYYTSQNYLGGKYARAADANGFTLKKDEFFVLGDNSPESYDSRWWTKSGYGNNGTVYSAGIVHRDYLLGKAVCVYWPSGFRLFKKAADAMIPNIGQMRLIYGGTKK